MRSDARKRLSECQHPNPVYSRSECGFCGGQDCHCRDCGAVLCGCRALLERRDDTIGQFLSACVCDAAAKVARVETLAADWATEGALLVNEDVREEGYILECCARELRAALDGDS